MKRYLMFALLILSLNLSSQSSTDTASNPGLTSTIVDHSGIQKFIEGHKMIVKKKPFIEGFRIQIYNGNNRDDANKIKSEFYSKYPGMRCYLTYQQPYYKVKVGDYQNPNAAKEDLRKLGRTYSSSFLVPDQIRRMGEEDKD